MDRFWAKVDKSGDCWVWTASKGRGGYGHFAINGVPRQAHRVAWEMLNGPIPPGMHVHHKCFTPACVRIDHLEILTPRANQQIKNPAKPRVGASGVRGVTWVGNIGKWRVRTKLADGREGTLGYFVDIDDALAAQRASV